MKHLIVALLALQFSNTAFANQERKLSPRGVFNATLTQLNLDKHDKRMSQVIDGTVSVDFNQQTVTLALTRRSSCPIGSYCPTVMPAPLVITVPIESVTEGTRCGERTIRAATDPRLMSKRETITVVDNRFFRCPTIQRVVPTHIEHSYYTTAVDGGPFYHTYSGEALVRQRSR
jgi:hypothetical protein